MADVLSQNEIDALLSALNSGEIQPDEVEKEDKHKAKLYDFRSPQKFSKDHIRTLELIHDNYSRIISNYLSGQIRSTVKVKVEYVEQTTYEEFIRSIPNPTILTLFKLPPLQGTILFETNPTFTYQIIDILLGGDGTSMYASTEFTDIDKNIISKINDGMISNLKLAWNDVLEVTPEIEGIETNPAFNQTLAPHEPVALITFSVHIGKINTFINLCIPYLSIEKVLDKLVFSYWYQENNEEILKESRDKIKQGINNVEVPMAALLGRTQISVDDFLRLAIGDIITLDNKCDEPIEVLVDENAHFIGKPGIVGKKIGVEILDIMNKEVEGDD